MKKLSSTIAIAAVLFSFSCSNNTTQKEESPAVDSAMITNANSDLFKAIVIKHPVKDYDKWKAAYFAHDSVRKVYGITHFVIGRELDNPNNVIIIDKMDDVNKAKEFSTLPALKSAMEQAGVSGPPAFSFIDVVRDDNTVIEQKDRVMVEHRVKDFDAWLKVYDSEGKDVRAANGLIDRGLARSIDDPNMVYIVFAISDMVKAKARMGSEDLKKIMMDAGVEGPPKITFYKLVD